MPSGSTWSAVARFFSRAWLSVVSTKTNGHTASDSVTNPKIVNGINITYNPIDQPAIICADRTQINRLFTNLFQNAIEASENKTVIDIIIDLNSNGNKLQIDFTDHGVGIPAEKQDKIFTPNFTTKSSGTGLGLAMCKSIVEQAHGKIWFETQKGQGTTFHVELPKANWSL